MKVINKICWILAIVLGVASIVLFFTNFATIVTGNGDATLAGSVLAAGGKVKVAGTEYDMAKSADILFCGLTTVISTVLAVLCFKSKKVRYAAPAFGAVTGVYMLVIALSNPWLFVDTRPLIGVTDVTYTPFVLVTAIAMLLFTVASTAHLLIDDKLEVMENGGLTIWKRVIRFFRDYKSEVKKIVWPNWKEVAKNTFIVLVICLIIGLFIWAVDFGIAKLIELILGVK